LNHEKGDDDTNARQKNVKGRMVAEPYDSEALPAPLAALKRGR